MSLSAARKIKLSVNFAKLLQEHHSDLRESLNIPVLIPLLRKQELLTVEEWEEMGKQNRFQRIDQLIQILPQKGEQAYLKFISCLESENEHPAHKELAIKLKKTRSRWQQSPRQNRPISRIRKSTADSDITKTDLKETITIKLMEQVTDVLQSELVGVDEMIHVYEERIASLQAQLADKERTIAMLSQGTEATNAEVTKFQQLLSYANSGYGSQPSLHFNTRLLAKHYHDTRKVLKTVKMFLKRDNNLVNQYLDAASEDSDSVRSRASSMDSEWQLNSPIARIQKPCSKQSIEEENEPVEENKPAEEENELSDQSSLSSADETDDEGLDTTQEQLGQDVHHVHHKYTKPLPNLQRPVSWPYPKKKRASKSTSNPISSVAASQAKADSPTDDDVNEDNQAIKPCITVTEENENDVNEDMSIACASVDQPPTMKEDQEESCCTVFAGYLQKEGDSEMWRKRYFTLTKEFLFYSKSEQDTAPLGMIPLIDLGLERKRKNSFEVINKRTSIIKVKKPGKKFVQSYKVLRLKASSEAEAAQWIHNIEDTITTLRTQYPTYD